MVVEQPHVRAGLCCGAAGALEPKEHLDVLEEIDTTVAGVALLIGLVGEEKVGKRGEEKVGKRGEQKRSAP